MMNLALWLKRYGFRADQVQAFYPSPMASATAMYYSGKNPLRRVTYKSDAIDSPKTPEQRRLHKAFLRYHDPKNWPLLREALKRMGRADLIGDGKHQLIPKTQPTDARDYQAPRRKNSSDAHQRRTATGNAPAKGKILTQHNGLPPREQAAGKSKPTGRATGKPGPKPVAAAGARKPPGNPRQRPGKNRTPR
jgi:hypothetical protein